MNHVQNQQKLTQSERERQKKMKKKRRITRQSTESRYKCNDFGLGDFESLWVLLLFTL